MRAAGVVLLLLVAACSGVDEPTATFTGEDCEYEGPAEFDLGSEVTFTLINESETTDMGYSVWTVPPGTTAGEIRQGGIFAVVGDDDSSPYKFYDFIPTPNAVGVPVQLTITPDTPGTHALICFDASSFAGPDVDHAVIFEVVGT